MTQAIIFDMDGLMFDTETLSVKGWHAAGQAQGVDITEAMVFQVFGLNPKSLGQFWTSQFGASFDHDKAMAGRIAYMKNDVQKNGVPIKPGLLELLSYLNEEGYPFAVASSSQKPMIHYYLALAGIDEYFKYIVGGDDVKKGKPAPDIFLKAATLMGVAPADCMVFEDSENGILAAHHAGMKPVMVPDKIKPSQDTKNLLYAELVSLGEGIGLFEREGKIEN